MLKSLPPLPPSRRPNVPTCLDLSVAQQQTPFHVHIICPKCATDSGDQPIHCILNTSSAPSIHSSIAPPHRLSGRPIMLTPNTGVSYRYPKPQTPYTTLWPHQQLRLNDGACSSSPQTRNGKIDWDEENGIAFATPACQLGHDVSLTISRKAKQEKDPQETSNLAQKIEKKLWESRTSRSVVKRWLLEIMSLALSISAMAGLIVLLSMYKDKPIPKWPHGLTLNACISVIFKVSSAALLLPISEALGQLKWSWFQGDHSKKKLWDFEIFDSASRGPWGSLLLLIRTKGRSLAALGAAITLFALILDPFLQQLVEYPERWQLQEGSGGSIHTATGYELYRSGDIYRSGFESMEFDPDLFAATYSFFYDRGIAPVVFGRGVRAEVPLKCPSSSCTWPEYETLGVCNNCADVSNRLEFHCMNSTLDWIQEPGQDENGVFYTHGTSCGWWIMADDPILMIGYNIGRNTSHTGEVLLTRTLPLYDIFTRKPLAGYNPVLHNRNPLVHAIIASGAHTDKIQRDTIPIAHECLLSWCVKTISSSYSEGGYTENIIATFTNNTLGPENIWSTKDVIYNSEITGKDYSYNENIIVKGSSGKEYHITNRTHVYTLALFDDIFPSFYTLINSTNLQHAKLRYKQWATIHPYTQSMNYNPFLYANISIHLENMANSMTNMIRSAATHTEKIYGSSFDLRAFVDVRWPWLAFPLSLLGLTTIFLIATIIRSSLEEHVGVWKTSAIPTLLYDHPHEVKNFIPSRMASTPRLREIKPKIPRLFGIRWKLTDKRDSDMPTLKNQMT